MSCAVCVWSDEVTGAKVAVRVMRQSICSSQYAIYRWTNWLSGWSILENLENELIQILSLFIHLDLFLLRNFYYKFYGERKHRERIGTKVEAL